MYASQELQVQFMDQEDPLEEGMATHSSILAWEIRWTEAAGGATVHGVVQSRTEVQSCTSVQLK